MFNYRLENLELMSKHGPEVWRQHNQRLEALLLGFVSILLQGVLFLIFVIITLLFIFSFIYLNIFSSFFCFGGGKCTGDSATNAALSWLHPEHCIMVYFTVFNTAYWCSNALIS